MNPIPNTQPPATEPAEHLEARFQRLAATWRAETAHLSSSTRITNHAAFREIVALGQPVVPLILRELERQPSLLVWALPQICAANPVPPEDAGKLVPMTEAWLRWARESSHRW
jgi:hypothetical protein